MRSRPPVAVIAWSANAGRAADLAAALGGEARSFFDLAVVDRRFVALRYAVSAWRTVGFLVARRPRSVVATNPPVLPGLLAWAYGRLAAAPVVLDSHPSAFDPHAHRELALQLPLHRWLTPRVAATLVASPGVERAVREWGGTPIVVHEPAPGWRVAPARPPGRRPRVLAIGSFAADEPTAAVIAAARRLGDCDLTLTGDRRRCSPGLLAAAPGNLSCPGFLRGERFRAALQDADVVLSLTGRPEAACRSAHEAVYARRPLVTSDSPTARELFPHAVHVDNDEASIARGVREALARHPELVATADGALTAQRARVALQLARLRGALGLPASERAPAGRPLALAGGRA